MASAPVYSLRPAAVFEALATSPDGLPSGEVAARLSLYGKNLLTEKDAIAAGPKFLIQLTHPLAWLLAIAGVISFFMQEPVLGMVIWILIFVNAGFSYWREHRTEQAMVVLRQLLPAYARLMRDGTEVNIPANGLVLGDVLILGEGDNIPADARLVEAYGLRTNNAVLTGEAVPARKTADASLREGISELERPNLVFAGTSVVSGTGRAVVYSTGMLTQFGRIAHLTQTVQEAPSPLQVELLRLTRLISVVALAIGIIVFIVGAFEVGLGIYEAFLLALGVIVAAVPEGLPAMITLTLAMAGQRLAQRNVLVKKLSVIETLGTVSTICTDKSGTLTQNQMTVREIWAAWQSWQVTGEGYEPQGNIIPAPPPGIEASAGLLAPSPAQQTPLPKPEGRPASHALEFLLGAAALCNNSRLSPPSLAKPRWTAIGDQTEAAMRVAALKYGLDERELSLVLPRLHELPFDARRKRMTTIHRLHDGHRPAWLQHCLPSASLPSIGRTPSAPTAELAFVKGAPREVLQLCTHILAKQEICALDAPGISEIMEINDRYAGRGLRVLALAFRLLPPRSGAYTSPGVERDLTFLGLMAMLDPARPEVAEAIRACRQAGIRMVMITGDYGLTAESLARRIGMLASDETTIVTGAELEALDDFQLQALLDKEVLFARMAPEHKLRLVTAFQERGEVVAVTGDGVNDAPALRKADAGVAMGISGTDVAREAADIVLVNDNFATIVSAIEEGRAIYDNLRKFVTYIFSSNVPEILPFILTALVNIPLALTVRQILAIDLGTDILPGLALGTEKPEPDIMRRLPRRRNQPLIDRSLLRRAFLWLGLIETILAFSGFFLFYALAGRSPWILFTNFPGWNFQALLQLLQQLQDAPAASGHLYAITLFHAGVVMAQVGNVFACRSEVHRGRSLGWLSNRFLIAGVMVEIGLIIILIYFPPFAAVFDHAPLPPTFWLWLGFYPFILYGLEWVRKFLVRRRTIITEAI